MTESELSYMNVTMMDISQCDNTMLSKKDIQWWSPLYKILKLAKQISLGQIVMIVKGQEKASGMLLNSWCGEWLFPFREIDYAVYVL